MSVTGCVSCDEIFTMQWSIENGFGGHACSSYCLKQYEEHQRMRAEAERRAPTLSPEQVEFLGSFLELGGRPGRRAGNSRYMPEDEVGKAIADVMMEEGMVNGPSWPGSTLISLTYLGEYTLAALDVAPAHAREGGSA